MNEISLTDFVDFVTTSGTPRLTKVRQLRKRGEYSPLRDFWRDLRMGLVDIHRRGEEDVKAALEGLVDEAPEAKKEHYAAAVRGYRRFLGRKSVHWFEPPKVDWVEGELSIRVNPELGLELDGVPTVVKVHFKSRKLGKRRVETILLLMEDALREQCNRGERFAVLDISEGKLFTSERPRWGLRPFLIGEARAMGTMWDELARVERNELAALWGVSPMQVPVGRLTPQGVPPLG